MTTILIQGVEYAEAEPDRKRIGPIGEVCSQCAFGLGRLRLCAEAIDRTPAAFGGDCAERDVIYKAVSPSPAKESEKV